MDFNHRQESLERLLTEMKELLIAKGHDYGDNEDSLSNFKLAELLGLKSYGGVLVRIGDKYSRLCEFSKKGEFKVNDESFKDTCIDLANYALLCYLCFEDEQSKLVSIAKKDDGTTKKCTDCVHVGFHDEWESYHCNKSHRHDNFVDENLDFAEKCEDFYGIYD